MYLSVQKALLMMMENIGKIIINRWHLQDCASSADWCNAAEALFAADHGYDGSGAGPLQAVPGGRGQVKLNPVFLIYHFNLVRMESEAEGGNKKLVSLTLKRQVSVYNIHLTVKLVLAN